MADILHKFSINAAPKIIYEAITTQEGLAGWWTPNTYAKPEPGSKLRFGFGSTYFKEMSIKALLPYKKVEWKCVAGTDEWIGTTIQFDIISEDDNSTVRFAHSNWENQTEMFSQCNYDWAMFLRSLKQLCERGKGFPFPNQHQ